MGSAVAPAAVVAAATLRVAVAGVGDGRGPGTYPVPAPLLNDEFFCEQAFILGNTPKDAQQGGGRIQVFGRFPLDCTFIFSNYFVLRPNCTNLLDSH